MKRIRSLLSLALLLVSTAVASGYALTDGLVSYWPLDVDNSGTTPDLAFGNTMTNFNAATLGAGQRNNAFSFNGTSQYLGIQHGTDAAGITGLPIYNAPAGYTVAMWVKGAAQTAKYVFAEGNLTNTNPLLLLQTGQAAASNSKLDMYVRTTAGGQQVNHATSIRVVFDGTWHHVAVVDNRGPVQVYVDGNADTNFTYVPGSLTLNTTTLGALVRVGNLTGTGFFNGAVDDVAIWERPLTQSEIQSVMNSSISTPLPPAVPVIFQSPVNSTNAMGDRAVFSVAAFGGRPLTYQWFKAGSLLSAQTNATLALIDLTAPATNGYSVIISNSFGSRTNTATLAVLPDPAPNVATNLVSFWPLNTVTNLPTTNSPDLYGHNNMQLNAMDPVTNLVAGQFGNALYFDTNYFQYANRVGGFPIYNNTNYSVALWVIGNGVGQVAKRAFSEGSTAGATPLFTLGTDAAGANQCLSVFIRTDANSPVINGKNSTGIAFDGTWHHIVWVDENGKGKLYIDGALDATDYTYSRGILTLDATSLGGILRNTTGSFFLGAIDEVGLWSRRLSYTEIQQIRSSGIPVPIADTPPAVTLQPADKTNAVFQGDTVSFTVQASGTSPLCYQWRKNGSDVPVGANPSAGTNILTLAGLVPADSGSYTVVITNAAGSITSSPALLAVTPYLPATTGEVLKLDFDLTTAPETQPGFASMTLGKNGTNFGGVGVTLSAIGTSLAERDRTIVPQVVNNPPALTDAALYNDFVFANSTVAGTGLRILIERLAPNTKYGVTIWSFDSQSPAFRASDWVETASGSTVTIQTGYTFDGDLPPAHDGDNTLGALLTSSASGKLQIEGRKSSGTSFTVFLNAIRLVAQPSIRIASAELASGKIRLTIEPQYAGQAIQILEASDPATHTWNPATGGGITETHGPTVIAEFPVGPDRMFYRVVSQ